MFFGQTKGRSGEKSSLQDAALKRWRDTSTTKPSGTTKSAGTADAPVDDFESVRLVSASQPEEQLPFTQTIDLRRTVVEESWELGAADEIDEAPPAREWRVAQEEVEQVARVAPPTINAALSQRAAESKISKTPARQPEVRPANPEPVRENGIRSKTAVQGVASKAPIDLGAARTERESFDRRTSERLATNDIGGVEEDLRRRFGSNIRSALSYGSVIDGKMSFDSPVRIDGTINGAVTSTSALVVGEQAVINAELKVGTIVILGTVEGDIEAAELVEIRRGGSLQGDILTKHLVIEEGGHFQGRCQQQR